MARHSAATAHPAQGDFAYDEAQFAGEPFEAEAPTEQSRMNRMMFGDKSKKVQHIDELIPLLPSKGTWKVRTAAIMLWVLLALAASGGVYAFAVARPKHVKPIAQYPDTVPPAAFAQEYVVTYLEKGNRESSDAAKRFYPGYNNVENIPVNQYYVRRSSVADVEIVNKEQCAANWNDCYFSVTIAVDLYKNTAKDTRKTEQAAWQPEGFTRYYRVGIKSGVDKNNYGTFAATSLPFQVPELKSGDEAPQLAMSSGTVKVPQKAEDTVNQFFDAYLAGKGDLQFVTTDNPQSHLRAIATTPFQAAEVRQIDFRYTAQGAAKQDEAWATATVLASQDNEKFVQQLQYTLLMKYENSKWLVDDIETAPPLADNQTTNTK